LIESQIKSKQEDIEYREKELKQTEKEIDECNYSDEEYNQIVYSYNITEEKIIKLTKAISEIEGKATEINKRIKELTTIIDKNEEYKKQLSDFDEFLTLFKEIRALYSKDGIQKDLRNKSRPLIEEYTNEFFEKFNFNYSDLKIDENYDISVYGQEGLTNLDMVSGGEKIAIALALRLGITWAMSKGNIETILLDEPTIHLDSYRRTELIDILRKMSLLPQMIIVTHDMELENAADHIIKIKKVDGVSMVVD
jgi:exonuclease SbcC